MSRKPAVVLLVAVGVVIIGLQVLGAVDPAVAGTVRRELVAEAELAAVLLTPIALVVEITRPGRS